MEKSHQNSEPSIPSVALRLAGNVACLATGLVGIGAIGYGVYQAATGDVQAAVAAYQAPEAAAHNEQEQDGSPLLIDGLWFAGGLIVLDLSGKGMKAISKSLERDIKP